MSWRYLPELAGDCLPVSTLRGGGRSAMLKKMRTANVSSSSVSRKGSLMTLPSGTMCERLTDASGVARWMSLVRGSRVGRIVQLEKRRERMMNEIYGLTPFALLERCNRHGCFWKMCRRCLGLTTSERWRGTWPSSFLIVVADGLPAVACRRRRWGRRISVSGCGLWHVPTRSGFLPTATTRDFRGAVRSKKRREAGGGPTLLEVVRMMAGVDGGQLNPDWGDWLMGFPIGWSGVGELEMDRFQLWQKLHGIY